MLANLLKFLTNDDKTFIPLIIYFQMLHFVLLHFLSVLIFSAIPSRDNPFARLKCSTVDIFLSALLRGFKLIWKVFIQLLSNHFPSFEFDIFLHLLQHCTLLYHYIHLLIQSILFSASWRSLNTNKLLLKKKISPSIAISSYALSKHKKNSQYFVQNQF